MSTTEQLFDAVREAALPGLWSKGVRLARGGNVSVEAAGDDEATLRVSEPGRTVAATATLYLADDEWTCDCTSTQDPCEHVTAAVIALRHAEREGVPLAPRADVSAELVYRFRRERGSVVLSRVLVHPDGREVALEKPFSTDPGGPAGFVPSHDDVTIDRILAAMLRGDHLEDRMPKIVRSLAERDGVELDGEPVRASAADVLPRVAVLDRKDEVVLEVTRAPEVDEVLCNGVARCGDELCPLGATDLTGLRLERLPLERAFAAAQLGELVGEILPELEARFSVEVSTRRLPKKSRGDRPRIAFNLEHKDRGLTVMPTLVYGDPVRARIDAGRLVLVGGDVPQRDEDEEHRLLAALRSELHLVPGRRIELSGNEAMRFASRIRSWAVEHDDASARSFFGQSELVPRLEITGDRIDLSFDLEDEADDADPHASGTRPRRTASADAVLKAWRGGLDLVPLDGGGWAPLPTDWLSRFGHHVADLLAARNDDGEVATFALPTLAQLCAELDHPPPPGLDRLEPLLEGFAGIPSAELPEDLRATLRPYQAAGVDWLAFLKKAGLGGVLADDMGLGKTLQTLCVLDGRSLVVCPRSVIHNWDSEIKKFRPAVSVNVFHGPDRALDDSSITLTTYALLRLDVDRLAAEDWDAIVLDEAQAIKNPDSQVARAAYRLSGKFRVSLSGTPVENRLDELWSQLHFVNRGLLGGRRDFVDRYAEPIGAGDTDAADRLRQRIKPFVLRRLKREVAPDLPPRTDVALEVELDDSERNVYDSVRAATRKEVVERLQMGGGVLAALEALLRLRQAACHGGLVPGQHAATSSKVARLLLALEDAAADGHKALVFSQWTSLLDLVEPHLEDARIPFVRLDGATRERGRVVDSFQDPAGPPVLLISLKAGGTGLNLTAADHVFLLDPWWNPAVEEQAADRAHRIGQDRPVMVYRIVAKDTVEEGILALQKRKRHLADAALSGAAGATGITRDELLALLE